MDIKSYRTDSIREQSVCSIYVAHNILTGGGQVQVEGKVTINFRRSEVEHLLEQMHSSNDHRTLAEVWRRRMLEHHRVSLRTCGWTHTELTLS